MNGCGEAGGRRRDGSPCTRETDGVRCWQHLESRDERIAEQKRRILEEYEKLPVMLQACREVDVSVVTVWRWRKVDEEFDRQLAEMEAVAETVRYRMMDDATTLKVIRGEASGTETIYMLGNASRRSGDERFKDVRQHEHSGKIGIEALVAKLPAEEVRRLLALPQEEQDAELERIMGMQVAGLLPAVTG